VCRFFQEKRGYAKKSQKGGIMGKRILFMMCLLVLVFALSGVSYAWQGRMGGMGDPFGLVADESDYLIHPAKIANGEGVRFYGDYRFTFTGVTKWDDRDPLTDVEGQEFRHNALIGASFPLWLGRMGLFFTYDGMRGDYDGRERAISLAMKNDLDAFTVRLLYGLPVGGGFKLGAEAQLAYRNELQKVDTLSAGSASLNTIWMPYPFPNDSSFLEALFKGSLEGKVGPLDVEFTLRGGLVLPGTNSSEWDNLARFGTLPLTGWNMNGEVHGWQVGGDLWLRYALAQDLTLPFLVRADYLHRTRDGFGPVFGMLTTSMSFQGEVRDLKITVGGGVDKAFGKATRIAAGIYYNFLQGQEDLTFTQIAPLESLYEHSTYPHSMEHQLLLRIVGEHIFSPVVTGRAGLNLFYGWVIPELTNDSFDTIFGADNTHEGPGHGYDWGFALSLGGTVKLKPITLEPFVGGGYRQFHVGMSGSEYVAFFPIVFPTAETISRNEWLVNAGLSILFDL
jgi:hypothetical protein